MLRSLQLWRHSLEPGGQRHNKILSDDFNVLTRFSIEFMWSDNKSEPSTKVTWSVSTNQRPGDRDTTRYTLMTVMFFQGSKLSVLFLLFAQFLDSSDILVKGDFQNAWLWMYLIEMTLNGNIFWLVWLVYKCHLLTSDWCIASENVTRVTKNVTRVPVTLCQ